MRKGVRGYAFVNNRIISLNIWGENKMKVIKLLGGVVGLVIVVVVAAIVYLVINLNTVVKQGVETYGPEVTQTSVTLDKVNIGLFDGKGELKQFTVGNPEGFTSDHLLKWDTIRLKVDPASLRGDVVVIDDFTVEGININAEQKGYSTNLQKFLDGMKTKSEPSQSKEEASPEKPSKEVRIALKHVKFANNSVNLISEKYGTYTLTMPEFELNALGDPNVGLTPAELGAAILKPLVERARKQAEKKAKELLEAELKGKLDAKKAELKEKLDAEKEAIESKSDEKKDELKGKLDSKLKGYLN